MQKKHKIIYKIVVDTLKENELKEFNRLYNRFFTFLDKILGNSIAEGADAKWQKWLTELDSLNSVNDILALKVVTAILYQEGDPYGHSITDVLAERFKRYFHNEEIDRREKIAFAVAYHSSKPKEYISQYSRYRFTEALDVLFVAEAKEDPLYILEQFDKFGEPNRDYFFYIGDKIPKKFLEFTRLVQEHRPELYLKALVNFVDYANETRDERADKFEFCNVSKELYEKIAQGDYSSEFRVENALQKLIQYSYMDTDWYEELFVLLWEIESKKEEQDKNSRLNYLQIGINSKNEKLLAEVYERFDIWRNSYQTFGFESVKPFLSHFREIEKLFQEALYDNLLCYARNFFLSNTIERKIIDDLVDTCYDMLEWLYRENRKYYFRLLISYLQVDRISDKPIKKRVMLANEALSRFLDEFELLANQNINDAVEILGVLLNKSDSGWYPTEFINRTLNKVYFIVEDKDAIRAKEELDRVIKKETEHYEKYDRGGPCPWRPLYAVEREYASSELLKRLSTSDDEQIRESIAENKKTSLELLAIMSKDDSEGVRARVAQNPNTSIEILKEMFVNDNEHTMVSHICGNPNMDEDFLYEMCQNGQGYYVSMNPNIPLKCIELLSVDNDKSIRYKVAKNSKTPQKILEKLSKDKEPYVRIAVASNPKTSKKVLEWLTQHYGNIGLSYTLLSYKKNIINGTKRFINQQKYDLHGNLRQFLLVDMMIPRKIDTAEKNHQIRNALLSNPNTPDNLQKKLNRDEKNYQIKRRKQENRREKMSLTPEIKDAFNKFFMIFMALATIGILVKSIPFTLHHMSKIMLITTLSTAYFFASKYKRTLIKKEYIQMILFGVFVHLTTTLFLFYKTEGVGFLKIIGNSLLHFDVGVGLTTFMIVVIPALVPTLFFSKFFLGKVLRGKDVK